MDVEKLKKNLKEENQPNFRTDQILKAVYQDGVSRFSEISNLPKNLREILDKKTDILPFSAEKIFLSNDRLTAKGLLRLKDGSLTETVLMSPRPGVWSLCLSCQIGCPMGCAFCATGSLGFKRNMTSEEIEGQILFWKQHMRENKISGRISNVVYMGMGEPFLNWKEVKKSLEALTDRKRFNIGARSISVSTVGIKGAIGKLLSCFPQVNLAVSLHFANDFQRKEFMPAGRNFDLDDLKTDLEKYFERSNRKVFLEYILFKDINDGKENARELVDFIRSFKRPRLLHVNLIRYNETSKLFRHSPHYKTQQFRNFLLNHAINVTQRKSLGADIEGACGQLAGR